MNFCSTKYNSFISLPYRLLDSPDCVCVSRSRRVVEDISDDPHDILREVVAIDQDQNSDHHLRNEDDQQDAGVGHGHAVGLLDSATAAEEGDEEDHASQHDEADGSECGIIFLEGISQITGLDEGHNTQTDECDTTQLEKRKRSLIKIL